MKKKPTHQPRKRFGQNFLTDEGVIAEIARAVNPDKDDNIVEIGPGQGALTRALLDYGCRLNAVEIDRDLQGLLQGIFSKEAFTLHNADALSFDFSSLASGDSKLRIVGNLPYNISTPLLFHLYRFGPIIEDMHFMLQKEVVERLAATPSTKVWGRLGVMTQIDHKVEYLFDVPPEAFYPQPKVQSAIVRLSPLYTPRHVDCDRSALSKFIQTAFALRRKTLRNNLKGLLSDEQILSLGIDPSIRAEALDIDALVALCKAASPQHSSS